MMSEPIETKTARERLRPRREPYWARVRTGLFVGYRKLENGTGTWIARRRTDEEKQEYRSFGDSVENYDQAVAFALEWASAVSAGVSARGISVSEACRRYADHIGQQKGARSKADVDGRFKRLVYGARLGKVDLSKLRTFDLRAWLVAQIAEGQDEAEDEEDIRRAKDSANRNLAPLKAALNLALRDHLVATDMGWKTVSKFKDVGRRRQTFLPRAQRNALISACADDIRQLVIAMLLTGARPGELANMSVRHLNPAEGTLALEGKTGHRVVTLSSAALEFFSSQIVGKEPAAPILATEFGSRWNKDSWKKPFRDAVKKANLPAATVMYTLRHTAISEMIAEGMDSFIVARLAGTSTAMIDKHYGHLNHDMTRAKLDILVML